MLQLDACRAREPQQRADLIDNEIINFLRRHLHRAPAEASEIGKTRMRSDRNTECFGFGNGLSHHPRITTMEATGNVGRGDVRQYLPVRADLIGAKALTHVAIQINTLHTRKIIIPRSVQFVA